MKHGSHTCAFALFAVAMRFNQCCCLVVTSYGSLFRGMMVYASSFFICYLTVVAVLLALEPVVDSSQYNVNESDIALIHGTVIVVYIIAMLAMWVLSLITTWEFLRNAVRCTPIRARPAVSSESEDEYAEIDV